MSRDNKSVFEKMNLDNQRRVSQQKMKLEMKETQQENLRKNVLINNKSTKIIAEKFKKEFLNVL